MNAPDRIVEAAASKDEEAVDRAIRPKKLADYVGQEQVKAQLEIFVKAAVNRGEAEPDGGPDGREAGARLVDVGRQDGDSRPGQSGA